MLVIDNYDSFTYNLVQMFMAFDISIYVHRADMISIDQACALSPDYILISPGPRDPASAGISKSLIARLYRDVPILGVCLGMQCINEVFEGRTLQAPLPVHGKTSIVEHGNCGIFKGIPSPFKAARYHSLMVELHKHGPLIKTSQTMDGIIMGISHPVFPVHGIQFHPESFMTEYGFMIIENFLHMGHMIKGNVNYD